MLEISDQLKTVRQEVLDAYNRDNGYFYCLKPYKYNEYIDGMAWNTPLIASCYKIGDIELAELAERYVQTIIDVGRDARTFAPIKVDDEWKESVNIKGLWYIEKPQSSAGPLGLKFAIDNGSKLKVPDYLKKKWESALYLTKLGWAFGFAVKYISSLRQHINTMFTAYLAKGSKPSWSMRWMYEHNAYFSYIGKKHCKIDKYPAMNKLENIKRTKCKKVVPLNFAKPTAWIWRRDPLIKYEGTPTEIVYTPIARLTAEYLQLSLALNGK